MISIPFSGSKRRCYKEVREIVSNGDYNSVFEPFGGSCILSVNLYHDGLVDRAVANDYDHFFDLYLEYLDLKDKIVKEGYERGLMRTVYTTHNGIAGYHRIYPDGSKKPIESPILKGKEREILQDIIHNNVPKKYWRYLSLGSNFTFSAVSSHENINLNDFCLFSRYLKTDKQREYIEALREIELEHLDYKVFLNKHDQLIRDSKSILILDPPYTGSFQDQYKNKFTDTDTKKLLDRVIDLGCDFIFFNKDIDKVEEWLKETNAVIAFTNKTGTTGNTIRKDVMAYVKRNKN